MAQLLYSGFLFCLWQNLEFYEKVFQQKSHSSSQMQEVSTYLVIKALIKTVLVTLLLILKKVYLWWSSVLVKPLSLRFTVNLFIVLKL